MDDDRLVEQAAPFLDACPGQPIHEASEAIDLEAVDLRDAFELRRVPAVMGELVVPLGGSEEAVATVASRVAEHEGRDPRPVGLERECEQIVERPDATGEAGVAVLFEHLRRRGPREVPLLGVLALDAPLDVADRVAVLVEFLLVGGAEIPAETDELAAGCVEHAAESIPSPGRRGCTAPAMRR